MENFPNICIKNKGTVTKITVDGKELNGVTSIDFSQKSMGEERIPVLKIELIPGQMVLETAAVPALPELFSPFYISRDKLVQAGITTDEILDSL